MGKISVFGGFGFIGSEFCRQFPSETIRVQKHEVVPPTNNILYLISTVSNYNVFDSPTLDVETNLMHFLDVLDASHKTFGTDFTFNLVSSWFVFGTESTKDTPLTEESPCDPKGFYSLTARCREQLLISYCETFKIKYRILRLANVLGHRDGKVSAKKNALQYLIDKLTHNEDIELYNGGKFYRDYIDVRDCAHAIKLVVEKGTHPVYNISNGTSYLFKDLIEKAKDYSMSTSNVWDKMDVVEFHNQVQVKDIFLSNKKLGELGYSPKYTIEETIREIIDNERA
jgi:nucleoside-diphosphate-sugar epimerase